MDAVRRAVHSVGSLASLFIFANVLTLCMMAWLFIRGDVWGVLAGTRMLDWLVRTGIVARTDADMGFIVGIPDHNLYLMATDPVDWTLVLVAIGLYVGHWLLKAVQFHGIARFCGIGGSSGQHVRAFTYGNGIGHLLPFNVGAVATASALEGQGATREQAALAIYVARLFVIFEIVLYSLVGLYLIGWTTWLIQIFWALVILGVAFLIVRTAQGRPSLSGAAAQLRLAGNIGVLLVRRPLILVSLAAQSIIAFALIDIIVYFISQAYTGTYVLLNVEPKLLLMGIVASYIARMVQITPGGTGQAELGFASALYLGGAGFGAAATIALLWGQSRYISMFIVFGIVLFRFGIETSVGKTLTLFRGAEPEPRAVAVNLT